MRFKVDYSTKNIIMGFISLIFIAALFLILSKFHLTIWWLIGFIFILGLIYHFVYTRTNNFVSGAIGEKDIDIELKKLGSDFIIIDKGLDTGRGNIDKIVIGPTGAWILEVKNHPSTVTFGNEVLLGNGKPFEKNFLGQAYAEAKTLEELVKSKTNLDIRVQPVAVFSNKYAKVRLGLNPYKGVYVIQKEWLIKLLTETRNYSLNSEMVKRIGTALRQA